MAGLAPLGVEERPTRIAKFSLVFVHVDAFPLAGLDAMPERIIVECVFFEDVTFISVFDRQGEST